MIDAQLGLEYFEEGSLTGFRLERLEVLNWGTFNQHVWTLKLGGTNGLLTGDIGTGKSTLVDAVTTLLVPAHRVAYNKAAGAATRERDLRSYVLGHYKSERGGFDETSSRPVALRDNTSYSVLLAVFGNTGYSHTVTLAQVFWVVDGVNQPKRFYAAAERDMSIASDFSGFGAEIRRLRKRLRDSGADVWDSFPPYGAWFRRRFGIHHNQALELFHQTVSMKSVGNLTHFVRSHMLEQFDAVPHVDALISHFDDLNRAHELVLTAKDQIETLEPLVLSLDRYEHLSETIEELERDQSALPPFIASRKSELVQQRLESIRDDLARKVEAIRRAEETKGTLVVKVEGLKDDIAKSGGDRLTVMAAKVRELEKERVVRESRAESYAELLARIGEEAPESPADYDSQRRRVAKIAETARQARDRLQRDLTERTVAFRQKQTEYGRLAEELASLRDRTTNIPAAQIAMRLELCRALDLDEDSLPFVGELVGVREDAQDWEGAAERLLRNFGLSLVVSERHYARVAAWVDQTFLSRRLVYFRVREQRGGLPDLHPDSLVRRLSVKPDSPHFSWLNRELAHRFDVACCVTQEQFRQEPLAITKAGQIKMRGERHEKDDRYRIDDRTRFVLGWENTAKVRTLETEARAMESQVADASGEVARLESEQTRLNSRVDTLSRIASYASYRDLDWQTVATQIAELNAEIEQLEMASDKLQQLRSQLDSARKRLEQAEQDLAEKIAASGRIAERIESHERLQQQLSDELARSDLDAARASFDRLEALLNERLGSKALKVETCEHYERTLNDDLRKRVAGNTKTRSNLQGLIVRSMTSFRNRYPSETSEADESIESGTLYRELLIRLRDDDLPSFEARFKELLNENTIREVANFQSLLDRERETIKGRIDQINDSLAVIDFNPGRYIKLLNEYAADQEIKAFRRSLKECTEGSLSGSDSDQYSERKFLKVKAVIERLRGREGLAEVDRRWVAKVTDVRNWFVFGASERWRESDSEFEHYSDSAGKSGGQKEKLAYTVLAASLSYQFGLESGSVRSRSFRFVVIDEAFARGSDESTRYALKLFSALRLQLLIVTPLQKIDIIEPFVESVGLVQIQDDRDSRLRNLSIREYREEKQRMVKLAEARAVLESSDREIDRPAKPN